MKGILPFNSVVDQKNIVELSDEWLYNVPAFFMHEPEISVGEKVEDDDTLRGFVIDIKQTKKGSTKSTGTAFKEPFILPLTNNAILTRVRCRRTAEMAKKRLIYLHKANEHTASLCSAASEFGEDTAVSEFFERHRSYEKQFSEDTAAVRNIWTTELHLSFYQLVHIREDVISYTAAASSNETSERDAIHQYLDQMGIPQPEYGVLPGLGAKNGKNIIVRAVMSFPFDGDFFDRYWTCHFVEYNPDRLSMQDDQPLIDPQKTALMSYLQQGQGKANPLEGKPKSPWYQRRVLELLLFDGILQQMIESADKILEQTRALVLRKRGFQTDDPTSNRRESALSDALKLFSEESSDAFLSTSSEWQTFHQILQVVQNDLDENLDTIRLWEGREKERGPDRPRWTRNDERRYRSAITKLMAANSHKKQQLERCRASISAFDASLTTRLDSMRSELELRGADDIRLFTYVTVVFLPIGFATGIFSMSGAPGSDTLVRMVVTAVVALCVTIFALVHAKLLSARVVGPVINIPNTALYYVLRLVVFPVAGHLSPDKQAALDEILHKMRNGTIDRAQKDSKQAQKQSEFRSWRQGREPDELGMERPNGHEPNRQTPLKWPPRRRQGRIQALFRLGASKREDIECQSPSAAMNPA